MREFALKFAQVMTDLDRAASGVAELREMMAALEETMQAEGPEGGKLNGYAPVTRILHAVADEYGVPVDQITGPGRGADLVAIRDEIVRRATDLGMSDTRIGRVLGGRDHTTILAARRRIAARTGA